MRFPVFLLALVLAFPANAQRWYTAPSTPDISVSATSTADFSFSRPSVDWVAIKNDCSDTLYFGLAPPNVTHTPGDYPIRLEPGETYSVEAYVRSVGASNDNAVTCTFTLQGRYR